MSPSQSLKMLFGFDKSAWYNTAPGVAGVVPVVAEGVPGVTEVTGGDDDGVVCLFVEFDIVLWVIAHHSPPPPATPVTRATPVRALITVRLDRRCSGFEGGIGEGFPLFEA